MFSVTIRAYGDLNDFLPGSRQQVPFQREIHTPTSIKDLVEGTGIPHTEISNLLLNDRHADFDTLIDGPCRVAAYPRFAALPELAVSSLLPEIPTPTRFVLDVHLGTLARYLRILGFDTLYDNSLDDETLAGISVEDDRLLLTRDRQLLMRRALLLGYFVRETSPKAQIREVIQRLRLTGQIAPYTRCPTCNGNVYPVPRSEINTRLQPHTSRHVDEFWKCADCDQVYWLGSHHNRLNEIVESAQSQSGRSRFSQHVEIRE